MFPQFPLARQPPSQRSYWFIVNELAGKIMSADAAATQSGNRPPKRSLLQSGIIFSAANIFVAAGNFAFQILMGHRLDNYQFGLVNATLSFVLLLNLPMNAATYAVAHYIARFHYSGDDARLLGLFAGCRKFLFRLTIGACVLAAVLIVPLSHFFLFPTPLVLAAFCVVVLTCWGTFVNSLCQGLGWFNRLAAIGLLAVILRMAFGTLTIAIPMAVIGVLASAFMLLSNLVLLVWRKDLARKAEPVSPWSLEFVQFLVVAAAFSVGTFFLNQGDLLVAKRYLPSDDLSALSAAGNFARNLPLAVGPLLTVLYTHRSRTHHHHDDALREQLKLLGLYTIALGCGVAFLLVFRTLCLKILGKYTPEAAAMLGPFSITMAFFGMSQAMAMWALASRWTKIAMLYGVLGLGYWLVLFFFGKTASALVHVMPIASGVAFAVLFVTWLIQMKQHRNPPQPDEPPLP
jgi:O-antigen/teichoic acid export membrane protein